MNKRIELARAHAKANLSFSYWKPRIFRMLTTTFGYWVGLEAINAGMNWTDFGTAIFKPVALFGLAIVLLGSGSTGGANGK